MIILILLLIMIIILIVVIIIVTLSHVTLLCLDLSIFAGLKYIKHTAPKNN